MNKIKIISTAELEKIQKEFSNPQTLQEHIILFGVTIEIEIRWGKPSETNPRIDLEKVEEALEEKETEVDELEETISNLNKKIGELEERLSQSANLETKTEVPA